MMQKKNEQPLFHLHNIKCNVCSLWKSSSLFVWNSKIHLFPLMNTRRVCLNLKGIILKGNIVWSEGRKQTSKAKVGYMYLSKLRNKFLKLVSLTWFTINMDKKRTSTFGLCKWTRNDGEVAYEVSLCTCIYTWRSLDYCHNYFI